MTAQAIADVFHARGMGRGRWQAHCLSHADRSPSLTIREGRGGRVLVHCHAGCNVEAVLEAAGLRMADLFAGPTPMPTQAAEAARERAQSEAENRKRWREHGAVVDRVRRLERVVNVLGAKLARLSDESPEGNEMTRLFQSALDKLRTAEMSELRLRP